jgi:hypothetical protein
VSTPSLCRICGRSRPMGLPMRFVTRESIRQSDSAQMAQRPRHVRHTASGFAEVPGPELKVPVERDCRGIQSDGAGIPNR